MGNCCTSEYKENSEKQFSLKGKKLKIAKQNILKRKKSKRTKFIKSKTMAKPIIRRKITHLDRSIEMSDEIKEDSARSSFKNPDFNPFLINSVPSEDSSFNIEFQAPRGEEEFDSMISRSQLNQRSHKFGNSALTNFSASNPLLRIQKEIPYHLLSHKRNGLLKEHPNFNNFNQLLDQRKNTEYFGETNSKGEKHGFGVEKLGSGDLYVGSFENGAIRGKGILYFGFGDAVKGYFGRFGQDGLNGLVKGVYRWRTGKKYSGDLKKGIPHGAGKYFLFQQFFFNKFFEIFEMFQCFSIFQ